MTSTRRPHVLVIGGGASGTLVALHLARLAARRSTSLEITVVDPAEYLGAGVAFGTSDDRHLLNVPAAGMSALPEDPGHFVTWRRRTAASHEAKGASDGYEFAPRRAYARYLRECLDEALASAAGDVTLRHRRARALALSHDDGVRLSLDDATELVGSAAVVATGLPSVGADWAPQELLDSAFLIADPWQPGALDVPRRDLAGPPDVLVVGTGLTAVDVALSLHDTRPGRRIHAVSRSGLLPHRHAETMLLSAIPDTSDWGDTLGQFRERFARHVAEVERTAGDWRSAVDGVRYQVPGLWQRLSEAERGRFLAEDAATWNRLRHRVPPTSAVTLDALQEGGLLTVTATTVAGVEPLPRGGLRVALSDGSRREVGWVVNATGPRLDIATLGDALLNDLLRGPAIRATAGMGFATDDGRLGEMPVWTLGALRRGELWESTAVPEIRSQASALAVALLDTLAPLPRRLADGRLVPGTHPVARPRDPLGLPLSTTREAAVAYNAGLERIMQLQSGAEELLREATDLDPGFALAHATLAMLGHEAGARTDVKASLAQARRAVRARGDARERSLVDVVGLRVRDARRRGAEALKAHIDEFPRDVLAVSSAVPTIAFSGVIDVQQEAWELVEGLAPAYGDHWWYISLLSFIRQDQGRFEEAGLLAESALSCEPSSGHAVHAQTHVLYETGKHETGARWLDHWVAESGRAASHRAHFSWHAALHELALGDTEAVRRRYYSQLADVVGVRALVDSASLLWRWRMTSPEPAPPMEPVLERVDAHLLDRPETPFVALHSALALAGVGDEVRLDGLVRHCRRAKDPVLRDVLTPIGRGLQAFIEEDYAGAVAMLAPLLPQLVRLGGSAAQREVVEDTLLFALIGAGRTEDAGLVLAERLDRRDSPLDARRRGALLTV